MAQKIFVTRTAVSKWEAGRGYPSLDTLKILAEFYGISIDDLISNEEIIDIDLLRQYAKQNILEAIITGDIHSHELQFWLYCMTHNISLEYHYRSTSGANNRFEFILTIEELKNAFQRNKAIDQSLLNAKETRH